MKGENKFMNKLFNKIAALSVGLAMAIGVGVAVGSQRSASKVHAVESVYYTLTPASGSNNSYAGNCDIEIGGITWNLTGNSQTQPWRIGGKSLNGVDREVYSKSAMNSAITKVELTVGAASSITVNSLKLIVASDADFADQIDEVSETFEASSTITFSPTSPATNWANGAYYKFVFNVTVSGSKNKFAEFTQAKFYKESGTSYTVTTSTNGLTLSANTITASGGDITLTTASKKKGSNVQVSNTAISSVSGNVVSLSNVTDNVTINCTIIDANITDFTVSGQKTAFTLSDNWSFGGTVSATYDDWVSPHTTADLESNQYTVDNSNFVAGTAGTYEISVTAGGITKTYNVEVSDAKYYTLVEDANGLVDGAEVVLVTNATTASVAKRYAMTRTISNSLNGFAEVSISNDGILRNATTSAYAYTLEKNGQNWDLYNESTSKYLLSEANKKMNESATASSHWTISISSGVATITSTYADSVGKIMFNWNSGSARFTTYTSAASATMILPSIYQYNDNAPTTSYDVIDSVTNGTLSVDSVKEGKTLNATIIPDSKYVVPSTVTSVTMDGDPVEYTYSNGIVTVNNVSGDVEITASCIHAPGLWEDTAFTVSEAKDAIDAQSTISDAYASGIISQVDSYNPNYNSITYWISADGETTGQQLEVYSGKGLNGANFTSVNDIEVGAQVLIKGNLKKFTKSGDVIYEFDISSQLISYTAPVHTTPTITLSSSTALLSMGGSSVTITVTIESFNDDTATISVDGSAPNYVNVSISGTTITLAAKAVGNETITIKGVNGTQSDSKELKVAVTTHAGTKNDPYTVADAKIAIDGVAGVNNVYISGLVSSVDSLASGSLTYMISDDGTTTSQQFEIFKGKGINGRSFSDLTDISEGDAAIVLCNIKLYNSSVYETDAGSSLVTAKEFARVLLDETDTVCAGYDGTTNNKSALSSIWSTLGGANYWGALPTSQQTVFTNATPDYENDSSDLTENGAGRYDMLCKKYFSTDNFANRNVSGAPVSSNQSGLSSFVINNSNSTINSIAVIIVISLISLTAVGGYFFLRKKKTK